jgi:hypothetical protein
VLAAVHSDTLQLDLVGFAVECIAHDGLDAAPLLVLILRQVKVARDAGRLARPPRRLRDAQRRQAGANDAAQIVVGPVRQRDSVMILAATPGRVVLKRPDSSENSRDRLRLVQSGRPSRRLGKQQARFIVRA